MTCPARGASTGAIVRASGEHRHQGSENSALKKIAESSLTTRRTSDSASTLRSLPAHPSVPVKRSERAVKQPQGASVGANKSGRAGKPSGASRFIVAHVSDNVGRRRRRR